MAGLFVEKSLKLGSPERRVSLRAIANGFNLHGVGDRLVKPLRRRRFDDEIESAMAHRVDDSLDAALRGLHDDRRRNIALAHLLQHAVPIRAWHDKVEHHHGNVVAMALKRGESGLSCRRRSPDGRIS
jgi:hypothetical protein